MKICFASHNKNKVRELNKLVGNTHELVGLDELGITEDIPETGSTFEENSRIKAKYVFDRFQIPVFADDSGLLVFSLNNEPGVFSARYAGAQKSDEDNIQLVLQKLINVEHRGASFKTVITFIDKAGNEVQFSGEIAGNITHEKRGKNGFGYDPIFIPEGYDATFAELAPEVKNSISHRAKAVKLLIDHLKHINE